MPKITDRPRLKDVARLAGVGTMTASRVLNGGQVGSEVRERVHDAMRRLHYRPDQLARSLRTRQTRMLGLVVPSLSDPFFASIADSVSKAALIRGYAILVATTNGNSDLEIQAIHEMLSRRVEGILHVPKARFSAGSIGRELDDVRVVAIDRTFRESRVDLVCIDNFSGASKAVSHLVSHGHSRITCISESNSFDTVWERQEGYFSAMAEHGLSPSLISQFARRNSTTLIGDLVQGRHAPSAILTVDWPATKLVFNVLEHLRIRIPDDVAMIGCDDFESADLLSSSLSTVRPPAREIGRAAAERIIEQLQAKPTNTPPQVLKFAAELVIRQSCGCSMD